MEQLGQLKELYAEWNSKINVISRKDMDNFYERHVLHSLAITEFVTFLPGAQVLDLGTGGGFPGIPLAILFPETEFTLIDGTLKKIKVVKEIAEALQLQNITAQQKRVEEWKGHKFDFVVTRAVAPLLKLYYWSVPIIKKQHFHATPNGIIALKGGDLIDEIKELPKKSYAELIPIDFYEEAFFETKAIVYVQG